MRWVSRALVLLLPACFHPNYDHPACGPGGACPSGLQCSVQGFCERPGAVNDDAGASSDASVMPDATRSTFCDPITGLVACYEFEGNAKDGSGNGLDATAMSVTFAPGRVGQAMQVGNSSNVTVSANNLFDDVSAFTIEAWIQPSTLAGTSDILNVNNEYAFSLRFDGRLSCSNRASGAGQVVSNTTVPTGQWTHVACTYDGVTENVYISGSNVGTRSSAGGTTGPNSMTLAGGPSGPPLLGLIDQLRLMSIARTAAEICADADRVSCP